MLFLPSLPWISGLQQEKDNLSIEEFQKESQRRDAMSEILKDRVAALKADPALAADRDPAVVLPDGATTGDRITAKDGISGNEWHY